MKQLQLEKLAKELSFLLSPYQQLALNKAFWFSEDIKCARSRMGGLCALRVKRMASGVRCTCPRNPGFTVTK